MSSEKSWTSTSSLTLRWLGVAGIELTADGYTLLIDPYLTRISFWRQWVGRVRPNRALLQTHLPHADAILITHAHIDHLLDAPEIAHRTGATLYGSANAVQIAALSGLSSAQLVQIGPGDRLALGPFTVQVEVSEHVPVPGYGPKPLKRGLRAPLRAVDYQMDICYRMLIAIDGYRLLTDPGVRPDDVPEADLLFLYPHHDADLAEWLRRVRPRAIWLTHWDDMWRPISRPLRPTLCVPRLAWPPIRRVDLNRLMADVAQAASGARLVVPRLTVPRLTVPRLLIPYRVEECL